MLISKKRVVLICPYPIGMAPSQRFRFEQYLDFLSDNGFEITVKPFLDQSTWSLLYKKGLFHRKTVGMVKSALKRFYLLFQLKHYDFVFMHREAMFFGPPILEWLIIKVFKKHVLYDFDDAIWLKNHSDSNAFLSITKWYSKVHSICKWVDVVQCGNQYLVDFALKYNSNVFVVPTSIDTEGMHNQTINYNRKVLTIGWTGSHSTMHYLGELVPVLKRLEEKYTFHFRVISDRNPNLPLMSFYYCKWDKANEIADLSLIDIGVMPLKDNEWSEGKCAFKGLQYMALGIPTVMSPVGVNKTLVNHMVNGVLASSEDEWYKALELFILDSNKRKSIGLEGQKTVLENYSVESLKTTYLNLFNKMSCF